VNAAVVVKEAVVQLVPPLLEISDLEGFTPDNDLFGLEPFGERLANLVCGLDRPLVIALDEPWGSGKTVFAKQWAGLLRQREVPVIYFDASRTISTRMPLRP